MSQFSSSRSPQSPSGEKEPVGFGERSDPAENEHSPVLRTMQRVNYERNSTARRRMDFKLDTVRIMLDRLGNPHRQLNVVHIAGTKGKGSTSHFVAQIGQKLGLKTGVYSSPHFERYTERFRINDCEVRESVLNPCLERVLAVAEELDREIEQGKLDLQPATFFDISTVAAFLLFVEQQVDLVALEVGLGGRLDSTNVCQAGATVITNISLDHTRQLGSTTLAIAGEKAGIIKSPVPVICGPVDDDVFEVIKQQAERYGAPLYRMERDFGFRAEQVRLPNSCFRFDYWNEPDDCSIKGIELQVLGRHQMANACLAMTAMIQMLPRLEPPAELDWKKSFHEGLRDTRLLGRLDIISQSPVVITDMAHNEASIEAMVAGLQTLSPSGRKQAIFSCSKDKDHLPMLRTLIGYFDRIILTQFQDNPRSCPLEQLHQDLLQLIGSESNGEGSIVPPTSNVEKLSTTCDAILQPIDAWKSAQRDIQSFEQTVICGSIFLVGELMPVLRKTRNAE